MASASVAALFVTLLSAPVTRADEGFWTKTRVAGGAYYADVEHPDVSLEKEVLIYVGNRDGYPR